MVHQGQVVQAEVLALQVLAEVREHRGLREHRVRQEVVEVQERVALQVVKELVE